MPLTTCPDCLKQVSDRIETCPFCGCPAKYFSSLTENAVLSIPIVENIKSIAEEKKKNYITFVFGTAQVQYPKNTENIAKLYGKYVSYADKYHKKYYELYASAGSIYSVLTDLSKNVINDIKLIVDEACKDLYSFGIKITSSDFIEEYEINFQHEIVSLYDLYDDIKQEKKEILYKREVEKASRGRWQGGGFGMKGAIKGAVNAAVLNAGSGLIHSIGDGITKSGDDRYINNKLFEIYNSNKNRNDFAQGVYRCFDYILEGIKEEMSDADIIDIDIFGSYREVESNYETVVKYESNSENILDGMVQCFSCVPEMFRYYEPVIKELFELDSDIEAFLQFWGLGDLYKKLEQTYAEIIMEDIYNPFVINVADIGIEIQEILDEGEKCTVVVGKVIKGNVYAGTAIALLKEDYCAGISTVISSICEEKEEVKTAKIGKVYKFILPIKQVSLFSTGMFLVDSNSLKKSEADLYAKFYIDEDVVIWGFDDYSMGHDEDVIFCFNLEDKYISYRGVDFSFAAPKVMEVYGQATKREFDSNNDVTLLYAKDYNWLTVLNALDVADFSLSYGFGKEYVIRFYFDANSKMILVTYMKNVDTSKEFSVKENCIVNSKIKLQIECHKCGKVLKDDAKFCNYCGQPNPLFVKACPTCGKQIKKEAKFCNFCGMQFV